MLSRDLKDTLLVTTNVVVVMAGVVVAANVVVAEGEIVPVVVMVAKVADTVADVGDRIVEGTGLAL